MKRTAVIALLLVPGIFPAHAAESLLPTDIHALGDCVTPRITAPTHALQARIDRAYCTDNNAGDADNLQRCLRNTATHSEVTFFHDSCGSDTGPFVISLGGNEYTLAKTRTTEGGVPVAGTYEGSGLRVRIEPGRRLRRSDISIDESGDEEYEVLVIVEKGAATQRIRGVFWRGR